MAQFDHYATSAEFSDYRRPVLKEVTVPESIKRRLPSKHYVFKMVVQWSNGSKTVVYRRYSLFFDFLVKLQELVSNLSQKNPKFAENPPQLPELPGKVLFGRTQIHQVAEKRRVKIEEFCQYLVSLPPEISESNLVLSFFNTWPDDTLQRPDITSPTSAKGRAASDPPPPVTPLPPSSPTTSNTSALTSSCSASDAVISHPDEMENLEQYRVLGNYQRKDSHQVNLTFGQIVHVIEKHDTGWWMVMSDDEQGYAPAAFLEPLEEGNKEDVHPEGETSEVYEAMESYVPQNEDEIGFNTGDKIEVLSKSMDGWWKIRCNGRVGYSPSTLIRRRTLSSSTSPGGLETIYESEKSIYEGLNIHKPPPRRNTIDQHKIYDVPRPINPVSVELPENPYADPAEIDSDEEPTYYRIPKSVKTATTGEMALKINGYGQPSKSLEDSKSVSSSSVGRKQPPPPLQSFPQQNSSEQPYSPSAPQTLVYPTPAQPQNKPAYGMESGPIYENTGDRTGSLPVYENTQVSLKQYKVSQKSPHLPDYEDMDGEDSTPPPPPPLVSAAPKNLDDYIDMEGEDTTPPPSRPPPVPAAPKNLGDYVDIDGEDSTPPPHPMAAINHDDYVDIDADNTYVNPYELRQSSPSARESLTSQPSEPVIKPPPLPATPPPKHKPKPQLHTPTALNFGGTPILDGEYIEMDPIYFEPPEEDEEEKPHPLPTSPLKPSSNQITTPAKTKASRPLPPPPYSEHRGMKQKSTSASEAMPTRKSTLTRTKSVEDFLSSSPREHHIARQHSPPLERRKQQPITQLPLTGISQLDVGSRMTTGFIKPKPARILAGKTRKVTPERTLVPPTDTLRTDLQWIKPHPPPRNLSPHHPVTQTVSEPFRSRNETDAPQVKTYMALSSYTSQVAGCISFSAGDKCVLVQKSNNNKWWLVNIGGKEGWTPADYWQEDMRPRVLTNVRPPDVPPQPLPTVHKLRSATVATDEFSSSLDFTSSTEQSLSDSSSSAKSLSGSSEVEKRALSASMEDRRPPPSSKPATGKAKGPPPAKPKPFPGTGSPLKKKDKPRPPPKPTSRPSTSPTSEEKMLSTPPLSTPPLSTLKKGNGPQTNGMFENSTEEGDALDGTYSLLADTRTVIQTPIATKPGQKQTHLLNGLLHNSLLVHMILAHHQMAAFLTSKLSPHSPTLARLLLCLCYPFCLCMASWNNWMATLHNQFSNLSHFASRPPSF